MVCYGISGVVNNDELPAEEGQAGDDVQAQGTQLPMAQLEALDVGLVFFLHFGHVAKAFISAYSISTIMSVKV